MNVQCDYCDWLDGAFSKEEIQMAKKYMKNAHHL
jgi:hypothetical protein